MNPSVLVIEPYFGGSHRAWAEGVRDHVNGHVELLTLPARWWKWRMRGAAVTMAEKCADLGSTPDVVLVSDMIDLAAFRTFSRPYLGDVPTALYFHESQLTYPESPRMARDLTYSMINWLSALAADRVYFNSNYHRDVFFAEVPGLLRHFPDHTHEHLIATVRDKSEVLEVGVDLTWVDETFEERSGPVRLIWNHRWEHDKDPAAFFAAIDELADEGLEFEVVVCGESFGQEPAEFQAAASRHGRRIVHMGYLEVDAYRRQLAAADVVVSTALHEFFGISVVEGVAAGCFPVLPRRLSYPELIPPSAHDACLYGEGELVDALRWAITHPDEARSIGSDLASGMARFGWSAMADRYNLALGSLAGGMVAE